jgi:hypothetical protein
MHTHDNLLSSAEQYYGLGWTLVPLVNKQPLRGCTRDVCSDHGEVLKLLVDPRVTGIGVLLGQRSGGVIAWDFDVLDCYRTFCDSDSELACAMPTARTPRPGRHAFAIATSEVRTRPIPGGHLLGDGSIIVLPPSRHENGGVYEWLSDPFNHELPTLDSDELSHLINAKPVHAIGVHKFASATEEPLGQGPLNNPLIHHTSLIACSDGSPFISYAVAQTVPTGYGQRNDRLFSYARMLRLAFAESEDVDELRPHVEAWHRAALPRIRTKRFDVTWKRFRQAWRDVRLPFGTTLGSIVALAQREPIAIAGRSRDRDRVASLFRAASIVHGGDFHLGCRTIGVCLNMRWSTANRICHELVARGLLKIVRPGKCGNGVPTGQATWWHWNGVGSQRGRGGNSSRVP